MAPAAEPEATCGEPLPYLVNVLPSWPADPASENAFRVEPFAPVVTFVKVRCAEAAAVLQDTWKLPARSSCPCSLAALPACLRWAAACRRLLLSTSRPCLQQQYTPLLRRPQVPTGSSGGADLAEAYLQRAVKEANEHMWGSLSCTVLVHPETEVGGLRLLLCGLPVSPVVHSCARPPQAELPSA